MIDAGKFERGILHFNSGRFFEAHEDWEELWLAESEPDKTFLQGLIQLAAAFHHSARGNRRGAESLFAAGIAKLARFPENCHGIALGRLRDEANAWAREFRSGKGRSGRMPPRIHSSGQPRGIKRPPQRRSTAG